MQIHQYNSDCKILEYVFFFALYNIKMRCFVIKCTQISLPTRCWALFYWIEWPEIHSMWWLWSLWRRILYFAGVNPCILSTVSIPYLKLQNSFYPAFTLYITNTRPGHLVCSVDVNNLCTGNTKGKLYWTLCFTTCSLWCSTVKYFLLW